MAGDRRIVVATALLKDLRAIPAIDIRAGGLKGYVLGAIFALGYAEKLSNATWRSLAKTRPDVYDKWLDQSMKGKFWTTNNARGWKCGFYLNSCCVRLAAALERAIKIKFEETEKKNFWKIVNKRRFPFWDYPALFAVHSQVNAFKHATCFDDSWDLDLVRQAATEMITLLIDIYPLKGSAGGASTK